MKIYTMFLALLIILVAAGCDSSPAITPVQPNGETPISTIPADENDVEQPVEKAAVGFTAPGFSLPALDGKNISLQELRGKHVVLLFWVMDCAACLEELPVVQEFYNNYGTGTVVVLTIGVGDPASVIRDFISQHNYTFPVLLDESADVCIKYGRGAPTAFFVDEDGIILLIRDEVFHSVEELEQTLKDVYGL